MKLSWGLLVAVVVSICVLSIRSVFAIAPNNTSSRSGEIASGESTTRAPLRPIKNGQIERLPQTGVSVSITSDNKLFLKNILEEETTLDIPKINIHTFLYKGQLLEHELLLKNGKIFEYENMIYAHNSTGSFGQIVNLKPGDMIYKTVSKSVSNFIVISVNWVDENNTSILTDNPNALLLVTCDFTNPHLRVVVIAEKIHEN